VSEGLEPVREAHGIAWMDGVATDLRHAFRALTRNRGFGTVAILVLAASVAINTLIFFMLQGVVLRPLPYASPERLVRLYDAGTTLPKFPMSVGHYLDYRANAKSIEAIALYTGRDMELSASDNRSQQLTGVAITTDYFSVLGRAPILGRGFSDEDLRTEIKHAVLSYRLWKDHFQSDPAIVGKTIRLDREPWTIIGVAPEGFQHVGGDYRSP
jgi:macrolide transport system ATP-binding/permease protein